jgi:hypothetical protein
VKDSKHILQESSKESSSKVEEEEDEAEMYEKEGGVGGVEDEDEKVLEHLCEMERNWKVGRLNTK